MLYSFIYVNSTMFVVFVLTFMSDFWCLFQSAD
jgi:hypothetical protein